MIALKPVQSSSLAAVGHDPATNTLAVRFTNGSVYHYADVPAAEAEALLASPSVGAYFAKKIRPAYRGTPIAAEDQPTEA